MIDGISLCLISLIGEHLKLEWAKVAAATNCDSSLSHQLVPSSAFMLPEQDDFLYPPY